MKQRLAFMVASGFFVGLIPGAPGTYASGLTSLVLYVGSDPGRPIPLELHVSMLVLATVLGVMAADQVCRSRGAGDPSYVVADEIAGQLAAFLFVPITAGSLVLGTILFRALDIWKPFGIRRLERLPAGVGIMADDLAAGLIACAALHATNLFLVR